ncbi:54S ribosomal protein L22, mitochondrial [Monascus purpureus]|uniref:54S ribosomal protein L22, mitochondrial n=1 Tax=Monascus purpureus TaxID=5098 RepID=A0A507QQV0_MONPU|nr:54S ribosomal protein L22, mitochondrial [Monascus purpureus]
MGICSGQVTSTQIGTIANSRAPSNLPKPEQVDNSSNGIEPPEQPSKQQPEQRQSRPSALSSIKDFFFGGKKSDAAKPKITRRSVAPQQKEGTLGEDSIFAEDLGASKQAPTPKTDRAASEWDGVIAPDALEQRNWEQMQPVLDPRPNARRRWERKMIAREIRRRGRLTKTEQIMRTELESLSKSHWFKTSIKKLGPLARQIAGKNIDEAILQMRLSKKKAAKDVLEHLEHAKNEAMVRWGMGLEAPKEDGPAPTPITITLSNGERKKITNPTSIYIAQAWVNRGPYERRIQHRARGSVHTLRPPWTSLSVLLKEEKTRIREWQDREAKALRQRKSHLWTQLPDRKVTAQNQYYSW